MKEDADRDRIDVRYDVRAVFEFNDGGNGFTIADASFSLTCGLYDGVPGRNTMADLINDRGVTEDDIDDVSGTRGMTRTDVIKRLGEKPVSPDNIRSMIIRAVIIDDVVAAESIDR